MSPTADLLLFLQRSPTPFHAVANIAETLENAGFLRLYEQDSWPNLAAGKYFVCRNDSALIAFKLRQTPSKHGFRLIGAHTDSPCLRLKPNAITVSNGYVRLGLEVYGGALLNPWFDRDLGVAGRVTVRDKSGAMENLLINVEKPIAFIPSLAIHLDKEANENRSINRQKHLPAVMCRMDQIDLDFTQQIKKWLKQQHPDRTVAEIPGFELSLYDCQAPGLVGLHQEFIASARLDNLLSCYAATRALMESNQNNNPVIVLNDHEEVGSVSASGAQGPFLHSVISRICGDSESLQRAMAHSMLVSADNAQGVHPNYPEVHEPAHRPLMNNGPVIKINHNQRYATNSETAALFKAVCDSNKIPCQSIVVRSDMGCGSTIGPITAARLGVRTVDVGVPQLGMHSIRELAGAKDQEYLAQALKGFFEFDQWPF